MALRPAHDPSPDAGSAPPIGAFRRRPWLRAQQASPGRLALVDVGPFRRPLMRPLQWRRRTEPQRRQPNMQVLSSALAATDPWCSGPTCQPVTLEIAGSNPVGSAIQLESSYAPSARPDGAFLCCVLAVNGCRAGTTLAALGPPLRAHGP